MIRPPLVLNIPHASRLIPDAYHGQYIEQNWVLIHEALQLTDWFTDELFSLPCRRP